MWTGRGTVALLPPVNLLEPSSPRQAARGQQSHLCPPRSPPLWLEPPCHRCWAMSAHQHHWGGKGRRQNPQLLWILSGQLCHGTRSTTVPQHGGQASPENRCPGRCLRLGVEDGPCAAGRHHAGRAAGLTMASADPHATARSHRGLVSVTSPSGWRLCFSLCAQILFWRGDSKPVPRWGANAHLVSGAWAAQSVEHLPLDFGSGYDLTVVGLSPRLGSALTAQSV